MALPGQSLIICSPVGEERASQMALVIKNLPTNERDTRDVGSIPESGRSPGVEMSPHSSILFWRISWAEELGVLQYKGSQSLQTSLSN